MLCGRGMYGWVPGMVSRRSGDEFGVLAWFPDEVVRIWAPGMVSRRSCDEFGTARDGLGWLGSDFGTDADYGRPRRVAIEYMGWMANIAHLDLNNNS